MKKTIGERISISAEISGIMNSRRLVLNYCCYLDLTDKLIDHRITIIYVLSCFMLSLLIYFSYRVCAF